MTEETIFAAALEKQPSDRADYLARACGSDTALRKRLEGLLAASDKAGNFMARPVIASADSADSATDRPRQKVEEQSEAVFFLTPSRRPDSFGRIGHYEVLQVLGKGGFGIVYRAFDDILQRVVAVKVMSPQLAATSPARKRFLREARSSAAVRHENVVQVYAVEELPLPYLAMEFIPGETLQQKLDRSGPLEVPEMLHIGRQIADGLAAAHSTDLIHRDIKPANVLIEGGPLQKVKITDFGLARAADDASISQSGITAGTPMFMAPEQVLGQTLDQRADLFSLGSVLYQMVTGRPPFRANNTMAVLKRVSEDTPRPIREIIPETPEWLCNIIAKLHAKNPNDRFQSAREVADLLADNEARLKANQVLAEEIHTVQVVPEGMTMRKQRSFWDYMFGIAVLLAVCALFYHRVYDRKNIPNMVGVPKPPDIGHYNIKGLLAGSEDDVLSRRLVGSWWGSESVGDGFTISGTDTYFPNHTHTFSGTFTRLDQEGKSIAISWSTTWRIENKRLYSTKTQSSMPEVIKVGETDVDDILKLTDDELTTKDSDGMIETVRRVGK